MTDRLNELMQELYAEHRAKIALHLNASKAGDSAQMDALTAELDILNAMLERLEIYAKANNLQG